MTKDEIKAYLHKNHPDAIKRMEEIGLRLLIKSRRANHVWSQDWRKEDCKCYRCQITKKDFEARGSDCFYPNAPKTISEVIKSEEINALALIDSAERIINKVLTGKELSGEILADLKQTYGIQPELTCDILDVRFSEYESSFLAEEKKHSELGRAGFKPKIITVN